MTLWTPINQAEISAKARKKMGTFPVSECLDAPHHWEATQLNKRLKDHDEKLEVCGWYGHAGGFRWIINWTNRDGAELLVRTIEDENEQYEPPSERWLEDLRRHDLWNEDDWAKNKRHLEDERRQEREEERLKEEEMAPLEEKVAKMYRDSGWSQREPGDPIKNFSFGHGTHRGKRPGN